MADRRKGLGVGTTRGLRSTGFALAVGGLALFPVGSAAAAARSRGVVTVQAVISPQYQAKTASQVVGAEPHGFIAGPSRGGSRGAAAEADLFKPATWYHSSPLQYELPNSISHRAALINHGYRALSAQETIPDTGPSKAIAIGGTGVDQEDARLLFRLGLVLAVAYAVFLAVWFWSTRVRAHHRRRAVRY
jgi:predicted outer membrane lipoprotein